MELQVVHVFHEIAHGLETFGFAEVNVQALFEFANELDHVELIDAERFESRILIDVFRRDVEVFLKDFFNGVERGHVRPLDVVQYHKTCHAPLIVALFRLFYAQGDNREAGKGESGGKPECGMEGRLARQCAAASEEHHAGAAD